MCLNPIFLYRFWTPLMASHRKVGRGSPLMAINWRLIALMLL